MKTKQQEVATPVGRPMGPHLLGQGIDVGAVIMKAAYQPKIGLIAHC